MFLSQALGSIQTTKLVYKEMLFHSLLPRIHVWRCDWAIFCRFSHQTFDSHVFLKRVRQVVVEGEEGDLPINPEQTANLKQESNESFA